MKNSKLALLYFCLAYSIGTIIGFITFYIHVIVMWIVLFTIMPIIFGYYFYRYLKKTDCEVSESLKETNMLILLWIITSFLLDAIVYIIIVPILYGTQSNWTFFVDQSPWIWLNYMAIIIIGHCGRYFFLRRIKTIHLERFK
jgi:hypothetical protein